MDLQCVVCCRYGKRAAAVYIFEGMSVCFLCYTKAQAAVTEVDPNQLTIEEAV